MTTTTTKTGINLLDLLNAAENAEPEQEVADPKRAAADVEAELHGHLESLRKVQRRIRRREVRLDRMAAQAELAVSAIQVEQAFQLADYFENMFNGDRRAFRIAEVLRAAVPLIDELRDIRGE